MDSSEFAEDFKDALQDLKVNSKLEIDNLTVIAKENTAHAQAISSVLEQHIKNTRPEWMLPALYVLDSLVRHVGPPYSTYLGANLFRTFMDMYRQVNNQVRRDMEAVLRTWKEPPQGSRDTRPVMPVELTAPIENALAKFKAVTMQAQQPRPLPGQPMFRNSPQPGSMYQNGHGLQSTPAPVDMAALMGQLQQRTATPSYPYNSMVGMRPPQVSSPAMFSAMSAYAPPPSQTSTPLNMPEFQAPISTFAAPQGVTQDQLKTTVNDLLQSAKIQKMLDASNRDLPQLVSTLESLKGLLADRQFGPQDLIAMQSELSKISATLNSQIASILGNSAGNTPPPAPAMSRISLNGFPAVHTPPNVMPYTPPPLTYQTPIPVQNRIVSPPPQNQSMDIASLLGLLRSQPPAHAPSAPATTFPGFQPASMSVDPSPNANAQSAAPNSLLDMLRASGLLAENNPAPTAPITIPMSPQGGTKPISAGKNRYHVRLDQESITKIRRTPLIASLYQDIPDQCRQCGRRFPSTEHGKTEKKKHLDWHFSINSRVANSAQTSIVHRSPYLNELQWTRLRETEDGTDYMDADEAAKANATSQKDKEANEVYVLPPQDIARQKIPCSICMEPFTSVWHLKTQQPVWMDTVKVGNTYYHSSCYEEATAGPGIAFKAGGTTSNRATPEPVLGKRKFASVVA